MVWWQRTGFAKRALVSCGMRLPSPFQFNAACICNRGQGGQKGRRSVTIKHSTDTSGCMVMVAYGWAHTLSCEEHLNSIQRAACVLVLRACSFRGLFFGFVYVKKRMMTFHQSNVVSSACLGFPYRCSKGSLASVIARPASSGGIAQHLRRCAPLHLLIVVRG